jgi:hypothetical protein
VADSRSSWIVETPCGCLSRNCAITVFGWNRKADGDFRLAPASEVLTDVDVTYILYMFRSENAAVAETGRIDTVGWKTEVREHSGCNRATDGHGKIQFRIQRDPDH